MAASVEHHELPLPVITGQARLLIVVSPYYKAIAADLVAGACAVAQSVGVEVEQIEVPGALEIPAAIAMASRTGRYDAYVGLGCVIRGETTHYETVCNDSSRGLMLLGLQGTPVGNGILTVENPQQAQVRADPAGQNKGGGAAAAALHLLALRRRFALDGGAAERSLPQETDPIRLAGALDGPGRA